MTPTLSTARPERYSPVRYEAFRIDQGKIDGVFS